MFGIVHYIIPPFVEQRLFLVGNGQVNEQFGRVFPPETLPPQGC